MDNLSKNLKEMIGHVLDGKRIQFRFPNYCSEFQDFGDRGGDVKKVVEYLISNLDTEVRLKPDLKEEAYNLFSKTCSPTLHLEYSGIDMGLAFVRGFDEGVKATKKITREDS